MRGFKTHFKLWGYATLVSLLAVCLLLADGGADHQKKLARPIDLGVSGGNINDFDFPFCCGGTLGGLVEDPSTGVQYIVSNNHVLARSNRASIGDDIVQPGLIDVGCAQNTADAVADLSAFQEISFTSNNLVDAAIAATRTGAVKTDGSILDIGPLASTTAAAFVGQKVKKSGRTTGLTFGEVTAVDVTVNVSYSDKCGRSGGSTATFVQQIATTDISDAGDSGSVVVEDVATNPQAVGLLFAGSSSTTIANPMGFVLQAFGVAMVGGTPPEPPPTGSISGTVTDNGDGSAIGGATVSTDTGQSTTTAADGTYSLADVPTGDRQVTASKSGYENQTKAATVNENQNTVVDFALNASAGGGSNVFVDCITWTTSGGRFGDRHLQVAVSLVDDSGNPVSGASVSVTLFQNDSSVGSATGTTDSSGVVVFELKSSPNGCYRLVVNNVDASGSGLTWDGNYPPNGFQKGSDSTPDADCRSGSDDCGGASFGLPTFTRRSTVVPAPEKMSAAIAVKRRNELALMSLPNVVGVGVGAVNGNPVIEVYFATVDQASTARLPARLQNVPVLPKFTGPFIAGGGPGKACGSQKQACRSCTP